jgi:hypothetical protein
MLKINLLLGVKPGNDRTLQDPKYKAIGSGVHVKEQEMNASLQPFQIPRKALKDSGGS